MRDTPSLVLLSHARSGDSAALDELCRRYLPRLEEWAAGRLPMYARDLRDTADIVQESMIKTLRNLDRFEPRNEAALLVYLRQAVRNRIRDEIDRVGRRPEDSLPSRFDAPGREDSPVDEVVGREAVERYETALSDLSDSDRELIVNSVELKIGYEQLAEMTGRPSPHATRMATARALERLAKRMAVLEAR